MILSALLEEAGSSQYLTLLSLSFHPFSWAQSSWGIAEAAHGWALAAGVLEDTFLGAWERVLPRGRV